MSQKRKPTTETIVAKKRKELQPESLNQSADLYVEEWQELRQLLDTKQISRANYYLRFMDIMAKSLKESQPVQSDGNAIMQHRNTSAAMNQPEPPPRDNLPRAMAGSQSVPPDRVVHRLPNASADVICLGGATRDPYLEAFVNELRLITIGEDDDVLKLPDGSWLGGTADLCFMNGQFLIRQCYKELKNTLLRMGGSPRTCKFLILGSPRIGKSMFIYYLLHALLEEQKKEKPGEERSIIWQPAGRSDILCITGRKIYFADDLRAVEAELTKSSTWYLVDGKPPERFNAITVLVSTPDPRIWKSFEKRGVVTRYMSVWTWKEMKKAWECGIALRFTSTGLTLSEMKACFKKWGGIPGFVFQNARRPDVQASLVRAIAELNVDKLCEFIGDADGDDVLHSVLHLVANGSEKDCNTSYEMDLASPYVHQLVFNRVRRYNEEKVKQFVDAAAGEPMSASFRGLLFEAYAHNLVCSGREFTARKLGAAAGSEHFTVKFVAKRFDFGPWTDVIDTEDRYYVPKKMNCPSVNSLIYPNSLFQVTLSDTHAIDARGLVKVVNHMVPDEEVKEQVQLKFFFVVPSDKFDAFQLQGYTTDGKVAPPPTFKAGVSVEQFVLKADITSAYLNGTEDIFAMYADDESDSWSDDD